MTASNRRPRLVGGEKSFRWPVNGTETERAAVAGMARVMGLSFNRFIMDAVHEKLARTMHGDQEPSPVPLSPMLETAEAAAIDVLQAIQVLKAATENRQEVGPKTPDNGGYLLAADLSKVAA